MLVQNRPDRLVEVEFSGRRGRRRACGFGLKKRDDESHPEKNREGEIEKMPGGFQHASPNTITAPRKLRQSGRDLAVPPPIFSLSPLPPALSYHLDEISLTRMVPPNEAPIAAYDSKVEGNIIFTRLDAAINWMRKNSLWPMPMGLACCAIELMATGASRFDISRFGMEVMRFSPRQADVMIVSGTVTYKMALAVKRIYDQMPEPKWVIAMGACASSGGMYRSYAVLQGIDHLIPVDIYISGCPPRPEALLEGLMRLQRKIETESSFVDQKKELLASFT